MLSETSISAPSVVAVPTVQLLPTKLRTLQITPKSRALEMTPKLRTLEITPKSRALEMIPKSRALGDV